MRRLIPLLLTGALIASEPYATSELVAQARADGLAQDREWQTLLHVERNWYGARRSRVDDPEFFFSPQGKSDPAAELDATIVALFSQSDGGSAPPVDRFPARFEFLIRRLQLDRNRLPVAYAQVFEDAYRGLGPRSIAIAFPTAYMNTPASMFGHTLLIVGSRVKTGMAGQAINYAAQTDQDGGVAFAVKGIVGGYSGYYSLLPYWQKLNEYSDIEQRDVWEYELNLSTEEIRRLLLHVWEMRGVRTDYFFFDENCAYYLLYLLDAARPELALHDQASSWVIPLDTVRLMSDAGLVSAVTWRPSLTTKVRARMVRMSPERAERARLIALGELPASAAVDVDAAASAAELDLAIDYLQALRNRKKVALDAFQPRFLPILQARAKLGVPSSDPITKPPGVPPDQGHKSLRLGMGGGVHGGKTYIEGSIRPAYHDLLDPDAGYVPGAQIEFLGLTGRWYEQDARPTLERLDAIGLRSFSPRDRFFAPPSWKVDSGLVRELVGEAGHSEHHVFLDVGVGGCWSLPGRGLWYATFDADLRVVDSDPSVALGLGPELGAVVHVGPVALNPVARWSTFIGELPGDNWRFGIRGTVQVHRDLVVGFDLARSETWDFLSTSAGLRVLAYF